MLKVQRLLLDSIRHMSKQISNTQKRKILQDVNKIQRKFVSTKY